MNKKVWTGIDFANAEDRCMVSMEHSEWVAMKDRIEELESGRCDTCGANIYSGPPDCFMCGAPNCCQQCCRIDLLEAENTRLADRIEELNLLIRYADEKYTRLKLAVQLPTARATDPETSHEAAKDARFGQTMRQLNVLLTLHKTQWAGLTDFELAERTGTQQNSTGKRRLECQRAGLVEPFIMGGNKVKRPSRPGGKSMAQVWRLTEAGTVFIQEWMERNNAT